MATNNTIRFSLKENKLASRETVPFTADVRGYKTVGQEDIVSRMAGMNASVSRQEIIAVLDLLKTVIRDILLAGDRVSTDLFNARLSVKGGFASADDDYSDVRNWVQVRMIPAASLKKEVEGKARVEKVRGRKAVPEIDGVYDYATQSNNSVVTPGNAAEIRGANLDCDQADQTQGIFFVDKATNAAIRAAVVHKKSGGRIVFQTPVLAPGAYGLVLRRAFGSEIREGRLEADVSVN